MTHARLVKTLSSVALTLALPLSSIHAVAYADTVTPSAIALSAAALDGSSLSPTDQSNIDQIDNLSKRDTSTGGNFAGVTSEYLQQIIPVSIGKISVNAHKGDTFSFTVASSDTKTPRTLTLVPFSGTIHTATTDGVPVDLNYNNRTGAVDATIHDGSFENKTFDVPTLLMQRNLQTSNSYDPVNNSSQTPFVGAWDTATGQLIAVPTPADPSTPLGAVSDSALRKKLSLHGVKQKLFSSYYQPQTNVTARINFNRQDYSLITHLWTEQLRTGLNANSAFSEIVTPGDNTIDSSVNDDGFNKGVRVVISEGSGSDQKISRVLTPGVDWTFSDSGNPKITRLRVKTPVPQETRLRIDVALGFKGTATDPSMLLSQQSIIYTDQWNANEKKTITHTFGVKTPRISTGGDVKDHTIIDDLAEGSSDLGEKNQALSSDSDTQDSGSANTQDIVGAVAAVAVIGGIGSALWWAGTHMNTITNMIPKPPAPAPVPRTNPAQLVVPKPGSGDAVVRCPDPHDHAAVNIVNAQLQQQGNPDRCRIL